MKQLLIPLIVILGLLSACKEEVQDATKGHVTDIIERVTVNDQYAPGNVQASNNFRTDDIGVDAAHWSKEQPKPCVTSQMIRTMSNSKTTPKQD